MIGKRSIDSVKSFVFSSLPLKAEEQPECFDGWSSAVEAWLAGGTLDASRSRSEESGSTFNAADFLHALTVARSQLMGLLQHTSSSPVEVAAAQAR